MRFTEQLTNCLVGQIKILNLCMMMHLHLLKVSKIIHDKIKNIKVYMKSLYGGSLIDPLHYDQRITPPQALTRFQFLSEIDTNKLMKSAPKIMWAWSNAEHSSQANTDILAPFVTTILNQSLQHSEFFHH